VLQLKTIHPETFALFKDLSAHREMQCFSLAGGTALSLQLGHRISLDLDFFTQKAFDSIELFDFLRDSYVATNCIQSVNSLSLNLKWQDQNIKVDIIRHNYQMLRPLQQIEDASIFSLQDIAAMKLNAIANRGSKKDFYDIHALLNIFSIRDLLSFFEEKYPQINSYSVVKSMVYFADADIEPEPVSLVDITWDEIKTNLRNIVPAL